MEKRMRFVFVAVFFLAVLVIVYRMPEVGPLEENAGEYEAASGQEPGKVDSVTFEGIVQSLKDGDARLYREIERMAEEQRIEPVDAKVDPVWKAIPGYNGLELDVEQTYKLSRGQDRIFPVYREVPPRVQLEDLGAHPIYKGNPRKPMAALMINVAWGNEYLPVMLDILRDANVKATFFLDGSWLEKHADLAQEIVKEGHEIGNHAYSHKNMSELSRSAAYEEISKTQKLIREKLNVESTLFAPPSGDYDEETVEIAYGMNMKTILWTLDTVDWKNPAPEAIVRKITMRLEPGALILMHPTSSASQALPELIRNIKNKGLALGTVSELLSPKRLDQVESFFQF